MVKNDKVDAKRIALYASRFYDRATYYKRPSEELTRLNQLEAERTLYLVDLSKYKAQLTDQKEFMPKALYKSKSDRFKILMKSLEQVLKTIEEEMNSIIESTKVLSRQMDLLTSIDGVGPVVARNMIIVTEAFTRFDNPRQFCCYAGVLRLLILPEVASTQKIKYHRKPVNISKHYYIWLLSL